MRPRKLTLLLPGRNPAWVSQQRRWAESVSRNPHLTSTLSVEREGLETKNGGWVRLKNVMSVGWRELGVLTRNGDWLGSVGLFITGRGDGVRRHGVEEADGWMSFAALHWHVQRGAGVRNARRQCSRSGVGNGNGRGPPASRG